MSNYRELQERKLSEFSVLKNPRHYIKKKNQMSQSQLEVIIDRVSLYRYRLDLFVEEYFGVQLKLFQIILLYLMQTNTYFMYLASKGQGKSFITAVYASARAILYPNTYVVIASGT